jgi:uncharacterized protein (TIGR03437 family)
MSSTRNFARIIILLSAFSFLEGAAWSQETISTVHISTRPAGAPFFVDGKSYTGAAAFLWPAGSKHVLMAPLIQTQIRPGMRYTFQNWSSGGAVLQPASHIMTVTADPGISSFTADFTLEYRLWLSFYQCAEEPCFPAGSIWVNGTQYTQSAEIWVAPGTVASLQAVPSPGYVFVGWQQGPGGSTAFLSSVTVSEPMGLYPRFEIARPVVLESDPPGLQVLADRGPVYTPATFEWGRGTVHTVGVITPQVDGSGRAWVFSSWSDGGAPTHAYKVEPDSAGGTLVARFVPAATFTFLTTPLGLKLRVDGRENWPAYNFNWGAGETHTVSAPAQQTDSQGRVWAFQSWSNGGPASQEIAVLDDDVAAGRRLTAIYEPLARISVRSAPSGIAIQVDGEPCSTPCSLLRPAGAAVQVSAPSSVAVNEGARLDFQSWSDGQAPQRSFAAPAEGKNLTAAYQMMHRLTAVAEPVESAVWEIQPPSADGFYPEQSQVTVRVQGRPGYRFRHWEGDLAGPFSSGAVMMDGPRAVRAMFDAVPYLPPAAVSNAAGQTPGEAVAAGSAVAVFGVNLAPGQEIGPESPLAQTLAGVTVRLGSRLLPLYFVSPDQINVQLSGDLEPGEHTLAVRWEGKPEVQARFTVAPNAPGLFQHTFEGRPFGAFAREDGSPVSPEWPARRGEILTLYGTGFGPCDRRPPDGFRVPPGAAGALLDPAELVIAGEVVQPLAAGLAEGRVGVQSVRFRLGDAFAEGGALEVKLRVNGVESNTVLLPLE